MRQRRHVREAALQPAERALLTSQPVQVRAPVAGRDREEVRRQMGQMQPAEERTRPAAGGALPDGQPGRRGDAQATPPVGLSGATAAAALTRPRSAVPPPASANAVSMLPATPPTTVAAPAPRPPADAASPPPPGAALPGHPGGRVRTEAPRDSARRSDPGLLPAAPASPMAPVPSVLPPGQRIDRGGMPAAGPVPERRERSGDSPGRVSAPSALEGRDRRATSPTPISTAVPAMPATGSQQRPVEVPTTSPLPRIDTAGQRAGAPTSQPVMAPQRVERPPGEAARPVTAVRSERAEPRLPDRAPNGEDLLRQHRRQEARSDQAVAVRVDSPGLAAPARVDAQPPRERPAGAERAPGGSRPNEKRGDPREEIRGRQPGVQ